MTTGPAPAARALDSLTRCARASSRRPRGEEKALAAVAAPCLLASLDAHFSYPEQKHHFRFAALSPPARNSNNETAIRNRCK